MSSAVHDKLMPDLDFTKPFNGRTLRRVGEGDPRVGDGYAMSEGKWSPAGNASSHLIAINTKIAHQLGYCLRAYRVDQFSCGKVGGNGKSLQESVVEQNPESFGGRGD